MYSLRLCHDQCTRLKSSSAANADVPICHTIFWLKSQRFRRVKMATVSNFYPYNIVTCIECTCISSSWNTKAKPQLWNQSEALGYILAKFRARGMDWCELLSSLFFNPFCDFLFGQLVDLVQAVGSMGLSQNEMDLVVSARKLVRYLLRVLNMILVYSES